MTTRLFSSYSTGKVIVPSDATLQLFKCLYVGGTGTVTLIDESGTSVLFSAVPVGAYLWIGGTKVMATGTTATLIVGLN